MIEYWFKKTLFSLAPPLATYYLQRPHRFRWRDLEVVVLPGVFDPGLSPTTTFFLKFLQTRSLQGAEVLELGAGCGLLSLYAAQRGAQATASDISLKAVVNLQTNAQLQQLPLQVVRSDLLEEVPPQRYDYILINPPCYPGPIQEDTDYAYFCGEEYEFFQRLFTQLFTLHSPETHIYLLLPNDCDQKKIRYLASAMDQQLVAVMKGTQWGEGCCLFEVIRVPAPRLT